MFWKKKQPEVQTAPVTEPVKYICLAPNYLEVVADDEGDSLDEVKEEIFKKANTKVYTIEEIDKLSQIFEFDVQKGFHWVNYEHRPVVGHKKTMGTEHRWLGAKEGEHHDEIQSKLCEHLDYVKFYKRTDIQIVAMKVGFDVYARSDWETYMRTDWENPHSGKTVTYYSKQ